MRKETKVDLELTFNSSMMLSVYSLFSLPEMRWIEDISSLVPH